MSETKFIGLREEDVGKRGTLAHALYRLLRAGGDYDLVLDNIGKDSVADTVEYLQQNRVKPKTKDKTLEARRRRTKEPNTEGTTLVDNGIGWRQVDYATDENSVTVGVPDGYMAYHQQGRVPNAPRRPFLRLLPKREIIKLVNFHWKKVIAS